MARTPRQLLITGASGFLGWHLARLSREDWSVRGQYHTHRNLPDGAEPVQLDFSNFSEIPLLIEQYRPHLVIHTAAISNPNTCETRPDISYRINVDVPVILAEACAEHQIPMIFISTDLVFAGTEPPYAESDPARPINLYGRQKQEAEFRIRRILPESLICRIPLLFGFSGSPSRNFFMEIVESFNSGERLRLFDDEYRSLITGWTAARGILDLSHEQGLLHLGGRGSYSRYEFGVEVCRVFGFDSTLPEAGSSDDVNVLAARPKNVSLNSEQAYRLGFDPPSVREQLRYEYKRWKNQESRIGTQETRSKSC